MGDPGKIRSRLKGPGHPWEGWRIAAERPIKKEYGLKNKTEIWRASSALRRFSIQAKNLIRQRSKASPQAELEQKQLLSKLHKMGILEESAVLEDVLTLELKNILDRRLQTFVYKLGYALTPGQARQLIVHGHITIEGKKVTVPSYLVTRDEVAKIAFNPLSSFASENHPERAKKDQQSKLAEKKKADAKKKADEEAAEEQMTEEALKKIEKEVVATGVEE
jgi:small subunit ribosomal protein S4